MSIKILTTEEAKETEKICQKYGEVFESVSGKAKEDYFCDNTGVEIPKGSICVAVLVLPSKDHFNYQHQKNLLSTYVE